MAARIARHRPGAAGDPPIELLPPEPVRTGMQVAEVERTTTVGRWFDDVVERCGEWAGEPSGRGVRYPAVPSPAPVPGPRRQELQVFRQVWLPAEQVMSYLATAPARSTRWRRPRLDCSFSDLRREPDRAVWTAEGRLLPRWGLAGIRVRVSIYGLAGPRTVLDLVPLVTRRRFRSWRFARAGMGVLEALREEMRRVVPERAMPSPAAPSRPGPT